MSVLRISLIASMLSAVLIFGGSWSARAGVSCSAAHVQCSTQCFSKFKEGSARKACLKNCDKRYC